jgi:5'-3' exonuclease
MSIVLIDGDPLLFRTAWGCKTLKKARQAFDEGLKEVLDSCFSDECRIAVFGDTNYRKEVDPTYKSGDSRAKSKEANPQYFRLRRQLLNEKLVEEAVDMEADDYVRIWAEECRENGTPYVIASIDKDLQCIPGTHYLIHRKELIWVDEEEADIHYWTQILTGDSVDNIPGLYGIGPVKAGQILEGATTSKERKQKVIDKYYEVYGEDWRKELEHTGQLIHIRRTLDDDFAIPKEDGPSHE